MRIKGFITGIAFVLLMLSVISFAVEAFTVDSTTPPGPSGTEVNNTVGEQRNFNIKVSETANFTWYLDDSLLYNEYMQTTSSYSNTSSLGYWNVTVDADAVSGNGTISHTWLWNVTNPPPAIYRDPDTNPTTPQGSTQFFNASSNQEANFTWFIGEDDEQVQYNGTVAASTLVYYMNNSAGVGSYNVKVVIDNTNGTNSTTWVWNVITPPGPPPVTGLTLTRGATWINWTWVNPEEESGFNHTIVKINDTFQTITSNNYFNYTQFDPGTLNTISLQTVDASDNVNSTVVSNSSYTLNTPSGSNVLVSLNNLNVTFSQVDGEGNTSATIYSEKQPGWGDHSFLKIGNYYDITLIDATSSGNITVELGYNPPAGINESNVKLYHWNGTSWKDVTTYLYDGNNKVRGNVSSLSPFVVGVPPGPIITRISPDADSTETTGNNAATFKINVDQSATVIWKIDSITVNTTTSTPGEDISYSNSSTPSGNHTVNVTASNVNGTVSLEWTWTVHPKTYTTGNRIWDGSRPGDFSLKYTWNPMSFPGFYYDFRDDVGNEEITIALGGHDDRTIDKGDLTYITTPQEVSFGYSNFGKYEVIGFMAEKYFAGYTGNTTITNTRPSTSFAGISVLSQGQLHKVLIDDDTQRTVSVGSTLTLKEGYVLKAKDIDLGARTMLISLLKDGDEVDSTPLSAGETYVYKKRVGSVSDLPLIIARFDNVFSGREVQAAFLKGMFQISESATTVKTGNRFGRMEVTTVSKDEIKMENKDTISLSEGRTEDVMGDIKIVVADNSSAVRFALSVEKTGKFEVRSTVYREDDPVDIWTPYNFGMNIGKTSIGFYYDLDDGIGSESLKLEPLNGSTTIKDGKLIYTTTPEEVSFGYSKFGKYEVIGFMAEKYFAGYTGNTDIANTRPSTSFAGISVLSQGQLHKVLIDDDTQRTVSVGSTLTLKEGYVLKAKDIDLGARTMLISLLKDGNEVDSTPLSAGETYVYTKRVGSVSDLPLIIARFDNVFSGQEVQAAFLKGMFQISESATTVKTGNRFGRMEVTTVSKDEIKMSNDGSISLDKGRTEELMGSIKLKVADSDTLRFYFAVDVSPEMVANQLVIDSPAKATAGDAIKIKVTAGGNVVEGASISIDPVIGQIADKTDSDGVLNYTLPRTMKGTYNITADMLGYQKASKSIEVLEYIELRLSIDAPAKADQFETITIRVMHNGTPVSGATVAYDNVTIGTTDSEGTLNYKLETSGTHTISASKAGYITVARDIEVRMPFSEYKALDINVTPDVVFTNQEIVIRSNITNSGTKADTFPVDLIINNTVVDTMSVTLAPGDIKEINFTRKAKQLISSEKNTLPGNYTIEILGQKGLVEVKEEPTNYLLIGVIATGLGAIMIYLLTAKNKISLETIRSNMNMETIRRKLNLEAVKGLLVRSGKKGA